MDRRKLLALSASGAWLAADLGRPVNASDTSHDESGSKVKSVGATATPSWSGSSARSIKEFGAAGDGVADDTAGFKRAIDFVRRQQAAVRDTSQLPCIALPSGRYRLTDTIQTAPWIKLCSLGGVLLDFTQLPIDQDGIVCRNEIMDPPGDLRYPGNRSPFLDGSGGTISILGPGKLRSNGAGILMGNRDPKFPGAVRDAGGRYVVVSGWKSGLSFDPINVYLSSWVSCRFEQNAQDAIRAGSSSGKSINSGERMTFFDCTFSGSERALYVDSDGLDFVFDACSFDFNGDVICFGAQARYGTVALSHCHIEGFDQFLVNAVDAKERLRVGIDHSIVLPRHWKRTAQVNAPRRIVAGHCSFSATSIEVRFEAPVKDLGDTLIADECNVETLNGLSIQGFEILPARNRCLNVDAFFSSNTPGTSVDELSHWKVDGAGVVAQRDVANASVGMGSNSNTGPVAQMLSLKGSSSESSVVSLRAKVPFPIRPGEIVSAAFDVSVTGGIKRVALFVDFTDGAGNVLQSATKTATDFNGVLTMRVAVPPGSAQGSLRTTFKGWAGDLHLRGLAAWSLT